MSPKIIPVLVAPPPIEPIKLTDYRVNPITGCWIWLGHCNRQGYAIDDYGRLVERQMYWEHKGELPEGHEVGHLCWNPECINPEHFEPNVGVEFSHTRLAGVLNMALAREIRVKAAAGMPTAVLAAQYWVAPTTIRSVLLNVIWPDPTYQPRLKYHSRMEADPKTVRRVRALRAVGMSYGEIADRTRISLSKVKSYCSGRYIGPEYNPESGRTAEWVTQV
jgi:hypothetical protein